MYSTIVVGTDGSPDASEALRAAAELSRLTPGCEVHVVTAQHALSPAEVKRVTNEVPEDLRSLIHAHYGAEENLADARLIFSKAGVEAEYHGIDADPTDALLASAEKFSADLIVVGSRGQGLARRVLHGSVSTKIVHHAHCAVLVVKA